MKILQFLSWEYPPRIVGGLARHVYWLSRGLARRDIEVIIVTLDYPGAPRIEYVDNVKVIRVRSYVLPSPDFASWVHQFNIWMVKDALNELHNISIIHAHDWLSALSALTLKHALRKPLIVTIHSTEYGRRGGIFDNLQRHIHEVEWWLTYEAWRVIVCSEYMKGEVINVFNLPSDKIDVIPNGVNPIDLSKPIDTANTRRRYAEDWEKIILFVGRLVHAKGIHIFVEAGMDLLKRRSDVKFIVVGDGVLRENMMRIISERGFSHKFFFTGFISDNDLNDLYRVCDVAVFPSLYEPFGIVALEAMSAAKPVIASDIGGLSNLVIDEFNGLKIPPNNPYALSRAIERIISNPEFSKYLGENGFHYVYKNYTWDKIVDMTLKTYSRVIEEYKRSGWYTK